MRTHKGLAASISLALVLGYLSMPASSLPGRDPADAPERFSIWMGEKGDPPTPYDSLEFSRSAGWDFGDREGYECVYIERFDDQGNLLFKVEIEASKDYPPDLNFIINDRGGLEVEHEPGTLEKDPVGTPDGCGGAAGQSGWTWNPATEDHFPHHTHHHFFVDGRELSDGNPDDGLIGLSRGQCARGYWTPGDEAGESILWWDEDFPENMTAHGDPMGALDCGGGGEEPTAVARMLVIPVATNTGVCTHDNLDGSRCSGMTQPAAEPSPQTEPSPEPQPSPEPTDGPSPEPSPTAEPTETEAPDPSPSPPAPAPSPSASCEPNPKTGRCKGGKTG